MSRYLDVDCVPFQIPSRTIISPPRAPAEVKSNLPALENKASPPPLQLVHLTTSGSTVPTIRVPTPGHPGEEPTEWAWEIDAGGDYVQGVFSTAATTSRTVVLQLAPTMTPGAGVLQARATVQDIEGRVQHQVEQSFPITNSSRTVSWDLGPLPAGIVRLQVSLQPGTLSTVQVLTIAYHH